MRRGLRLALGSALLWAICAAPASAQGYGGYGYMGGWGGGWGPGWGSTPIGDFGIGFGAAASGLGQYDLLSAQAASINADTAMRWSSFMWASQNAVNREHAYRMLAERQRNKTLNDAIQTRLRENPNKGDIDRADALNAILDQLSDPRVHPSALRMAKVPLNSRWIQDVPFHYAPEGVTLSLYRINGDEGWPPILAGPEFAAEREAYEKAMHKALEEDKDLDLSSGTIQAVSDAIVALREKVDEVIPHNNRDWFDAQSYLRNLAGFARMLKNPEIDKMVASLETYPGTTVADLLAFMQMFNLRFGSATTARERGLYQSLYPLLDQQRDAIMKQLAARSPESGTAVPPPPSPAGTGIMHEMPWESLVGRRNAAEGKKATARP